jgi:hypothetical protein
MMRCQAEAHKYPFDSSDSTNVAINHNRQRRKTGQNIGQFAKRIDNKIQASAGAEAEHQIKQPLDWHVQAYDEDLARATAPDATEADIWLFRYRHGELPQTEAEASTKLVSMLEAAGYVITDTDAPVAANDNADGLDIPAFLRRTA